MNRRDSNFDSTSSDPLGPSDPTRSSLVGEGEIMAYVEGELPPAREAQVRAWIAQRPRMQVRLEEMRRERELLLSTQDEAAPAGLLESAVQMAERSALLDEPETTFADLPPAPISIEHVRRERGRLPQLAGLAAAIIVTGAGLYALWPRTPAPIPGNVALKSHEQTPLMSKIAQAPEETHMLADRADEAKAEAVTLAAESAAPVVLEEVIGPRMPRPTTEISRERALILAGEGRLRIKVAAMEPVKTIAAVNSLLRTSAGRELGMERAAPTAVVAMIERPSTRPLFRDRAVEAEELAIAGPEALSTTRVQSKRTESVEVPAVHAVYVAEIGADEASIAALMDALSAGPDRVVVLEELPDAAWQAPKIDEETVLWWEQPAANWDKRVSVPVVVEGM